jgi:hypothetical protein
MGLVDQATGAVNSNALLGRTWNRNQGIEFCLMRIRGEMNRERLSQPSEGARFPAPPPPASS